MRWRLFCELDELYRMSVLPGDISRLLAVHEFLTLFQLCMHAADTQWIGLHALRHYKKHEKYCRELSLVEQPVFFRFETFSVFYMDHEQGFHAVFKLTLHSMQIKTCLQPAAWTLSLLKFVCCWIIFNFWTSRPSDKCHFFRFFLLIHNWDIRMQL